jgi:hypothetical protein
MIGKIGRWFCQHYLILQVIHPAFVRVAVFSLGSGGAEEGLEGAGAISTGEPVILAFALWERLLDLGAVDETAIGASVGRPS